MSTRRFYVTTAIPYVNGDPHVGHALEFVQADVLARHRRLRGDDVRFLSGTDDNALKNVEAAAAAGRPVAELVGENAARFEQLARALSLSNDDFIRTSVDPRHRPGVERLWRACASAGDLYEREYEGLYCTGCEAFVSPAELVDGRCAEHGRAPERVAERNWFFRLSRYEDALVEQVETGRLRIEPPHRRNEVLGFLRAGLEDFSVSRPRERAGGWGVPVPGDASQVVYVWFDALGNYVTALDYGSGGAAHERWWRGSDERLHAIGKGILRFHAVYWPAILLSAGEPLPTTIFVHDYLTANGSKVSKSLGNAVDPAGLIGRYGVDSLRWWFLRDVPRSGDTDFREELLAARANELADGLGNLVGRTLGLVGKADGVGPAASPLRHLLPAAVDRALATCDLRAGAGAVWEAVVETNRFVSARRPWELPAGAERETVLATLFDACRTIAAELGPFLPDAASRISAALDSGDPALGRTLFPKFAR